MSIFQSMLLNFIYSVVSILQMPPLRSVGRSNYDKGRHNLTTLIEKSTYINEKLLYIYIYITQQFSSKYVAFSLINVVKFLFYANHYEIGPSNDSIKRFLKNALMCI